LSLIEGLDIRRFHSKFGPNHIGATVYPGPVGIAITAARLEVGFLPNEFHLYVVD
jgi:hypothetical protein